VDLSVRPEAIALGGIAGAICCLAISLKNMFGLR